MDTECDDMGAMLTSPVLDQTRGRRAAVLGGTHRKFYVKFQGTSTPVREDNVLLPRKKILDEISGFTCMCVGQPT
jgi:hypothetical protein